MKTITHEVGSRVLNGKLIPIVRNYFLHEPKKDWFKETHKSYTKDQKKQAKLQHKEYLRVNAL